jgi:hypothetical protein
MSQIKNLLKIFFTGVLGFLIFAILLVAMNFLAKSFQNEIFLEVVGFLNKNFLFIILFSFIFIFGELFGALVFPLNLPSPLLNAVGSIFLIRFLFNVLGFVSLLLGIYLEVNFEYIYFILIVAVFLIILISGYVSIFLNIKKEKRNKEKKKT